MSFSTSLTLVIIQAELGVSNLISISFSSRWFNNSIKNLLLKPISILSPSYLHSNLSSALFEKSKSSELIIISDPAIFNFIAFELLFENKFSVRPKTTSNPTGLSTEAQTYPAIYLKNNGGRNEPFTFGGQDVTTVDTRAIVVSDSAFSLDAVCNILKDLNSTYVPILNKDEMPFNALGMPTGNLTINANGDNRPGIGYNYTGITQGKVQEGDAAYITDVFVSKIVSNRGDFQNVNTDVFSAFVDFSIEKQRFPRL